jgi:hypothetical protein
VKGGAHIRLGYRPLPVWREEIGLIKLTHRPVAGLDPAIHV